MRDWRAAWLAAAALWSADEDARAEDNAFIPAAHPKIALVLSGGGARGLAHIGVLKALREARVPVDLIVATSMGSIVGGAYAAGRTPEEMEDLVAHADWRLMFSDRPPREYLSFRRKEDDLRFIGKTEIGLKREGVVLPRGAFGAQNLEEFLRFVASPAADARHLDQLPIPLRAVATDLVTGESVVLRDVPLAVAMRASMSIPGAFAPTRVDDLLLGDGGLARNLPVEVARDAGAEVIIAVNVGTPLLPRGALGSAIGVAQQMVNILTEQNVRISLAALRPADILVSPDLDGVSFIDFDRGAELVARGESAGRAAAARFAPLALPPKEYEAWEFRRTRAPVAYDKAIAAIRVEGAARTNPVALEREIAARTGLVAGTSPTDGSLVEAARVLNGLGEFERVDVYATVENERKVIVVDVDEKTWGPDYLRIAARAVSDFHTDGRFSITLQHTRTWVNSWGAEWRNEVQLGDIRRFTTSFYQPLGPGSPWFLEPLVETAQSDFDIFGNASHPTDRITQATMQASVAFGRRIGATGVFRAGGGYAQYRATPLISETLEGTSKERGAFLRASLTFDSLDDANFPRRGYLANAGAASTGYGTGPRVGTYTLSTLLPVTFGRLTLLGIAAAERSGSDRVGSGLGGFFNLSGTPVGSITGSQAAIAGLLAYYRMGELPRAIGRNWYAGISLEAGNAWARRSDIDLASVRKAASLFLGLDTVAGPLYLGWGHTFGGSSALYLFLGRPAGNN